MIGIRLIVSFCIGVLTSFYFFPTLLIAFPYQNTKNILAAIGIFLFAINSAKRGTGKLSKDMFIATVYAFVFSLICFVSIVYNNTPDYTYATYFVSMWIWLAGAYAIYCIIKQFHGAFSLRLITNYLVGVCVFQCIIALLIDNYPGVSSFVNSIFIQPTEFFDNINRLYGIGAALDVAGTRFSLVLVLLSYQLMNIKADGHKFLIFFYIASFVIITVIGNMIARTTIIGTLIGIFYMVYFTLYSKRKDAGIITIWKWFAAILALSIPICVYYYNTNESFHSNIRFAFEGFFSLVEKGYWQTDSNDRLKSMAKWPDNMKTWIIGDGYMENPTKVNPYFMGYFTGNFYMQTDIGYCRFIFYCGVIGLIAFSAFFINLTNSLCKKFPKYGILFLLLLLLNFIIWLKVATDIFLAFALLLCIETEENEEDIEEFALEETNNKEEQDTLTQA